MFTCKMSHDLDARKSSEPCLRCEILGDCVRAKFKGSGFCGSDPLSLGQWFLQFWGWAEGNIMPVALFKCAHAWNTCYKAWRPLYPLGFRLRSLWPVGSIFHKSICSTMLTSPFNFLLNLKGPFHGSHIEHVKTFSSIRWECWSSAVFLTATGEVARWWSEPFKINIISFSDTYFYVLLY